jgi:exodeoxyribonuclease-3
VLWSRGMKIATWNVNGIRARQRQVLEWITGQRPDVVCLQELKAAAAQVPPELSDLPGYWCYWHGHGAYSGVGLHVRREVFPAPPVYGHPDFDYETRIVTAHVGDLVLASVYVPNGGKDFPAKLRFLAAMERWVATTHDQGLKLILAGDLNVTRSDLDVHPKERKAGAIGQRPEERELLERLLGRGLTDVGRAVDPTNEELFTWWAPWRNMRARNIGWRLDYVLATTALRARTCVVARDTGTSDHAPVIAEVE